MGAGITQIGPLKPLLFESYGGSGRMPAEIKAGITQIGPLKLRLFEPFRYRMRATPEEIKAGHADRPAEAPALRVLRWLGSVVSPGFEQGLAPPPLRQRFGS